MLKQDPKNAPITENINKSISYITYSLYHMKHYEDELKRNEYENLNYRFYDEREWRYIPEFQSTICKLKKTEEEYQIWRSQSDIKPLIKEVHLAFNPGDIEIIIFEKNDEREKVVELIRNSDLSFSNKAKEILMTKIQSFENIEGII